MFAGGHTAAVDEAKTSIEFQVEILSKSRIFHPTQREGEAASKERQSLPELSFC